MISRRSLTVRAATLALCAGATLAACGDGTKTPAASSVTPSPAITGVVSYSDLSHEHKLGKHITYPQNPPVGGEHAPYWMNCAVYTDSVPNEFAVHSLEHGAVWLTYLPGTAASDVEKLVELSKIRPEYTLVSPYSGQPSPIIATAWGLQLSVQNASDPRLKEFVSKYVGGGQGGEPGVPCTSGVTIAQAEKTFNQ